MARSPLDIGVADLRRAPGSRNAVLVEVVVADLGRDGIASADAELAATEPVRIELTLDSSPGYIDASGSLTTSWTGHCGVV